MKLSRGKTIAVLSGLMALAVVLTGAAFWREIVCAVYPEARLWGRWECIYPMGKKPLVDIPLGYKLVAEFSFPNKLSFGWVSDSDPYSGKLALVSMSEGMSFSESNFRYSFQYDRVKIFAQSGRPPANEYELEGDDTLIVVGDEFGIQPKLCHLHPRTDR